MNRFRLLALLGVCMAAPAFAQMQKDAPPPAAATNTDGALAFRP